MLIVEIITQPIVEHERLIKTMAARNIQKFTATERVLQRVKASAEKVISAGHFASAVRGSARNVTVPVQYTQQPTKKKETTLDDIMKFLHKLDDRITRTENLEFRGRVNLRKRKPGNDAHFRVSLRKTLAHKIKKRNVQVMQN